MKVNFKVMLFIILLMILSSFDFSIKVLQAGENETVTSEAVSYEIVRSKDISHKTWGNKRASEYTPYELQKLPIDKRMRYRIVVGKDIKKSQIRPTVEKIISDLTKKNPDIDEIFLRLYSTKDRVEVYCDIATAIWSTGGKLGGMTHKIVKENIRKGYEISIEISDNLEEYLKLISKKKENKLGFSESERRVIFKELVHCEDKAMVEAAKYYDPMCSKCPEFREDSFNDKLFPMQRKLESKYKEKIRIKYKITKEEQDQIEYEGSEKNWPLPKMIPFSNCCDY